MKISLVLPAYNEEQVIANTLRSALDFLKTHYDSYEIIAVNDGSLDQTAQIIKSFSEVVCISYPKNRGKGYALKRGALRSTGDYVFFTDADLSFPLSNIPRGVSLFKGQNAAAVLGVRTTKDTDYPYFRRVCSNAFQFLARHILNIQVPDTQCGFKGLTKAVARDFFSLSKTSGFCVDLELVQYLNFKNLPTALLPTSFLHRSNSRLNPFSHSLKMLKGLILLRQKGGHYNKNV